MTVEVHLLLKTGDSASRLTEHRSTATPKDYFTHTRNAQCVWRGIQVLRLQSYTTCDGDASLPDTEQFLHTEQHASREDHPPTPTNKVGSVCSRHQENRPHRKPQVLTTCLAGCSGKMLISLPCRCPQTSFNVSLSQAVLYVLRENHQNPNRSIEDLVSATVHFSLTDRDKGLLRKDAVQRHELSIQHNPPTTADNMDEPAGFKHHLGLLNTLLPPSTHLG